MESFSEMLRRLRCDQELSLRDLARAAHIDFGYLGQIERGARRCSAELAATLDQALSAAGALVAAHQAAPGQEDDVRRRALLGTMTSLAVSAVSSELALEALRQGLGVSLGGDRDQWQAIADGYSRDYYTTPATVLLERLALDITVLQHQIAARPNDRDLQRAAAQLSLVLAITMTFAGRTWSARRWWDTARQAADASCDLGIRVMVRSQHAVKGLYDGRSVHTVLDLANETVALAGDRVCAGVAGAWASKAQALALMGRAEEATAAVRSVAEVTARMPAAVQADVDSMFGWPEHRLRHTESNVFTEIGDTTRAMAAQDQALALYSDVQATNRSLVQMHRAACLIHDHHVAEGLRYAADVIDALPADQHNQMAYEVARRVMASVPASQQQRPDAIELRDRVHAMSAR